MTKLETNTLLQTFKTVGQQDRLKILGLLANRPHTVGELTKALGVKDTVIFHHLKRLKETGLATQDRSSGTFKLGSNAVERLNEMADPKAGGIPQTRTDQVLGQYLKGHRLKQIPVDPDERTIILRWLADKFTIGRRYSKSGVNNIISRHYQRQEMLRRYLVDSRLLLRSGDIYWRPQE